MDSNGTERYVFGVRIYLVYRCMIINDTVNEWNKKKKKKRNNKREWIESLVLRMCVYLNAFITHF